MFLVQCEEFRISHLTLFLVVTMLVGSCGGYNILRTSSDVFIFNSGLSSEGLFERDYYIWSLETFFMILRLYEDTVSN